MVNEEIIEKVRKFVEECFAKPESKYKESYEGHFIPVVNYTKRLSNEFDLNEDQKEILEISAWLHDIGSIIDGRENHHIVGVEIAEKKLRELNYPPEKIERVCHCILCHRGSKNLVPETREAKILIEADALSAFDNLEGLFEAAYGWERLHQREARISVREKLKRKYNQLSDSSKKLIKPKYEAAILLLGGEVC